MSEFDELHRLRNADPVDRTSIPSAEDPGPRALRERIMMQDTRTTPTRSRSWMIAGAAAAVALVAAVGIVLAAGGGDPAPPVGGPITGPGSASCVENYSLETLRNREVAFDGTVAAVNGDRVTFTIGEWFTGGSAGEVTLDGAASLGGVTSAGAGVSLEPGSRLLVAGDGGFAWGCGFTQEYDAGVAAEWRATLG